jgi:hypothetical protein
MIRSLLKTALTFAALLVALTSFGYKGDSTLHVTQMAAAEEPKPATKKQKDCIKSIQSKQKKIADALTDIKEMIKKRAVKQ